MRMFIPTLFVVNNPNVCQQQSEQIMLYSNNKIVAAMEMECCYKKHRYISQI